jgi:hypothetical protein
MIAFDDDGAPRLLDDEGARWMALLGSMFPREPMSAPGLLAVVHGPLADCTCRAVVATDDGFEHQPGCKAVEP